MRAFASTHAPGHGIHKREREKRDARDHEDGTRNQPAPRWPIHVNTEAHAPSIGSGRGFNLAHYPEVYVA